MPFWLLLLGIAQPAFADAGACGKARPEIKKEFDSAKVRECAEKKCPALLQASLKGSYPDKLRGKGKRMENLCAAACKCPATQAAVVEEAEREACRKQSAVAPGQGGDQKQAFVATLSKALQGAKQADQSAEDWDAAAKNCSALSEQLGSAARQLAAHYEAIGAMPKEAHDKPVYRP